MFVSPAPQMQHAPLYDSQLHALFASLPALVARECEHIVALLTLLDVYVVRGGRGWFSSCASVVSSVIGEVVCAYALGWQGAAALTPRGRCSLCWSPQWCSASYGQSSCC